MTKRKRLEKRDNASHTDFVYELKPQLRDPSPLSITFCTK
jgi:hypothetical protein